MMFPRHLETWQKNLLVLWIGAFVTSASYSMVIPFLPLFLVQIGVTHHREMWAGVLFSVPFLCGALIAPYWGSLADKYGRKLMILRSGLALCFVYTMTAFVHHPYELLVLRALQGLLSGYIPGAIALVGTNTPERRVGYALAMMATATATGNIMGPILGGGIAKLVSNRVSFATAGVLVFLSTLLVLFWVKEEKFVPSKTRSSVFGAIRTAAANRTFLGVMALTCFTAFSVMTIEPVLTLYVLQLGVKMSDASLTSGIVFSLAGLANIVFGPMWGKLADRIGFRTVLVVGLLGGGVGNLLQIPFHNIYAFGAVRFLYGVFFCAVFPALNGLVVKSTSSDFRGRAFGLNQTANQLGTMLGPMVGGFLGGTLGIHSVFALTGGLLLITMGFAYWARARERNAAALGEISTSRSV